VDTQKTGSIHENQLFTNLFLSNVGTLVIAIGIAIAASVAMSMSVLIPATGEIGFAQRHPQM